MRGAELLVIHYRTPGLAAALLADLAPLAGEARVLVFDNASLPETRARLEAAAPFAEVLSSERNLGFAGAVNAALPQLRGERLWLLNSDLRIPTPRASLAALEQALASDPRVAAVGPALRDPSGALPPGGGGRELGLRSAARHLLGLNLRDGEGGLFLQARALRGGPRPVDWLAGAAPLLRTAALRRVGGFPSESFLYGEDLQLGRRLRGAGYRLLFHPGVELTHVGQGSQPQPTGRWVQALLEDHERRAGAAPARALAALFAAGLGARWLLRRASGHPAAGRLGVDARVALGWARRGGAG